MYEQYQLPYGYDALEPSIDTLTMETHHGKHHATYTKTLNDTVQAAGLPEQPIEELLGNLNKIADENVRNMIRNHGGGYYNHNLYFSTLTPGGSAPEGAFLAQVEKDFGSLDVCIEQLSKAALGQFGSGWAFLSVKADGPLVISKSPNQDNPISEGTGNTPILALDVWEHAYYLKYKNLRGDYIKAFFEVVDWKKVSALYEAAKK